MLLLFRDRPEDSLHGDLGTFSPIIFNGVTTLRKVRRFRESGPLANYVEALRP